MSTYKVQDNSTNGVGTVVQLLKHFIPYAQKQLGFHKPVMISFDSDADNATKMLGRTGQYNPDDFSVSIYVDGRHPKDVLRSLSHELVHHTQNCNGDFDSAGELGAGYAQENPAMRDAELDAYKRGNIIFRDFEDLIKRGKIKVNIDFKEEGEPKMSLKEWKNTEINSKLMDKWGYSSKEEVLEEGAYRGEDTPVYNRDDGASSAEGTKRELPDIARLKTLLDRVKFPEFTNKLVDQPAEVKPFVDMFMSMLGSAPEQAVLLALRGALQAYMEKSREPEAAAVEPEKKAAERPLQTQATTTQATTTGEVDEIPLDEATEAKMTLTIDEARTVARKIFERISEERK